MLSPMEYILDTVEESFKNVPHYIKTFKVVESEKSVIVYPYVANETEDDIVCNVKMHFSLHKESLNIEIYEIEYNQYLEMYTLYFHEMTNNNLNFLCDKVIEHLYSV